MNEVTFTILKVVISICSALITLYVVPYIYSLKENKKYDQAVKIIEVAVRAAEQVIGSGKGSLKKAEVVKFLHLWLERNGITILDDQLDQLIESCVYQLKQENAK